MNSGLADFIEQHAEQILEHAMLFAKSVVVATPLDDVALRDHLPDILEAIVEDLRTAQTRAQEIEKSEGRTIAAAGTPRSAAAVHALFRAQSGFDISELVSEYRALRASVLRLWTESPGWSASPHEVTRFNEAIDEAIAESVSHYSLEVERWRNIFLGVLGHDLRSPLSAILLTSELIARMSLDTPMTVAAQRLVRSGKRMVELLDKLLVFNRVQMGVGFQVEKEDVDLVPACRYEIEMLQAALPGIPIRFSCNGPARGMFDAGRVREVLANLVVNAAKYGDKGGEVSIELDSDEDVIELAVSNPGAGIEREQFDLMFEPLRRGGIASMETERVSLGLGLFIVHQIALAHAGTVSGESRNRVTTFRMRLPRH